MLQVDYIASDSVDLLMLRSPQSNQEAKICNHRGGSFKYNAQESMRLLA